MAGKKEKNNYFEMLIAMTEFSCAAARNLDQVLRAFEPSKMPEQMDYLHGIEHSGDQEKHKMMKKLLKEFITPIDREDIISLAHEIDNVTDAIEDVLLRIYMYNINTILPEALQFTQLIVQCCDEMKVIMEEFESFKKSGKIYDSVIEMNRLEEVGDALYKDAVRALYVGGGDPVKITAWTEVYHKLEGCCDACEHVANAVESVMMKNS